jgi:hypothetical protein
MDGIAAVSGRLCVVWATPLRYQTHDFAWAAQMQAKNMDEVFKTSASGSMMRQWVAALQEG